MTARALLSDLSSLTARNGQQVLLSASADPENHPIFNSLPTVISQRNGLFDPSTRPDIMASDCCFVE